MADMKKSSSKGRYGKPPKIAKEPEGGDTDKSVHMEKASKEAKSTSKNENEAHAKADSPKAEGNVTSGTDGIPTHVRHVGEHDDMHRRHMSEMMEMHSKHSRERMAHMGGKE